MRLGLSSDAARGAPVADLVDICERRGLHALEVTLGAGPRAEDLAPLLGAGSPVGVAGLLCTTGDALSDGASAARLLGAPVIVGGDAAFDVRMRRARELLASGTDARVLVRGPAAGWIGFAVDAAVPFAWQIDEACTDAAADAALILGTSGRIDYIRLVGGGPESAQQEGRGVGALMGLLALSACTAPVILTPSSQRYRLAWSAWLGRRGGWGCGRAAERQASPIPLVIRGDPR